MATATIKPTALTISGNAKKQKTLQQYADSGAPAPSRPASKPDMQPAPPQEPRPAARPARPQPLDLRRTPSQDSLCSTPGITTPKDQLIHAEMSIEEGPPALRHGTSKPASRAQVAGGEEDQLQARDQSAGPWFAASGAAPPSGRPPKPKVRVVEPPMPCNPYLAQTRSGDGRYSFQAAESCLQPEGYSRFMWDYHQEVELGHGNFSKVYRAVHRLTGVAFAVKTNRSPITTLQARNMWLNEMQALAAVQGHPHIVRLHDAWFEPDPRSGGGAERVFLKMELCGDSLGGLAKRRLQLSEQGAVDLLRQMASALKRIHELGMVHLDVKPDNIYTVLGRGLGLAGAPERAVGANPHAVGRGGGVNTPGGGGGGTCSGSGAVFKLGDFGLAMSEGGRRSGASEGDCRYLAPEALRTRGFLASGLADRLDIFALGATVYELLRGAELPKNGAEYLELRSGRVALSGVDARLVTLLKRMMAPEPSQRPTAEQLLKMPLLVPGGGGGGCSPPRRQSTPLPSASASFPSSLLPVMRRGSYGMPYTVAMLRPPVGLSPYSLGPQLLPARRRSVSCTR
ncbi:hypothetical protein PLESTF_001901600 [Pleodorina starrii]|nr:hypothetical protein PLESTF_001901600 [Pleodorina starrii]